MTDLRDDYEPDYKVELKVHLLRVGEVVYISHHRIWELARVEAVGADWAVARDDWDRLHLIEEDYPPNGTKKKEKPRERIID